METRMRRWRRRWMRPRMETRMTRSVRSIWQRVFVKGRPHLTDPCVACCHCHPLPSSVFLKTQRAPQCAQKCACTMCTLNTSVCSAMCTLQCALNNVHTAHFSVLNNVHSEHFSECTMCTCTIHPTGRSELDNPRAVMWMHVFTWDPNGTAKGTPHETPRGTPNGLPK